ncbi:conserved protein of unknown function [Pseudomonas marincola]|uniref:Uncharacterized protein n=1 Tax=Pseudomonas marincola TaxID=437900 RepID=A0A653E3H2_9PSED|nr:conserved protein of unknown function [Pseudomonas marincola]
MPAQAAAQVKLTAFDCSEAIESFPVNRQGEKLPGIAGLICMRACRVTCCMSIIEMVFGERVWTQFLSAALRSTQ